MLSRGVEWWSDCSTVTNTTRRNGWCRRRCRLRMRINLRHAYTTVRDREVSITISMRGPQLPKRSVLSCVSCLMRRSSWSGVVVSALVSINKVNQRRARLVLRWVTISRFNSRLGTFISVCDQPPWSTQPGHPFVGRCDEYQPKSGDALRLGSKGRYGSCVGGR